MLDIYLTMESLNHPKLKNIKLETILKALGDPVRLSVVRQLMAADGEEKACGTFEYDVTKATFSHHIRILVEAGVLFKRQDGTRSMTSIRRDDLEKKFPGLLDMILAAES